MPAQEENHTLGQNKDDVTEKVRIPSSLCQLCTRGTEIWGEWKREIFTTALKSIKIIMEDEIKNGQIQTRYLILRDT